MPQNTTGGTPQIHGCGAFPVSKRDSGKVEMDHLGKGIQVEIQKDREESNLSSLKFPVKLSVAEKNTSQSKANDKQLANHILLKQLRDMERYKYSILTHWLTRICQFQFYISFFLLR